MRKITFLFSLVVIPFLVGCATPDPKSQQLGSLELNISKDSAIVEQENIKSAVAILIKKTEKGDIELAESKSLSNQNKDSIQQLIQQIKQLSSKVDDISVKSSMTTDDIKTLKDNLSSFMALKIQDNNTSVAQTSKSLVDNIKTTATVSDIVDVSSIATNKSDKSSKHSSHKKKREKKKTSHRNCNCDKRESGKKKLTSNYEKRMKIAAKKKNLATTEKTITLSK